MRVYVNSIGLDVPAGSTALDAVRAWSAAAADEVALGDRVIADSRGLPTSPDTPAHGGAIFRVLPARRRRDEADEPND
jgi:hypothetical protein